MREFVVFYGRRPRARSAKRCIEVATTTMMTSQPGDAGVCAGLQPAVRFIDRIKVYGWTAVWARRVARGFAEPFRNENRPKGCLRNRPDGLHHVRTTQEVICAHDS